MDLELLMIFIFVIALTAIVMGVGNEMYRNHLRHREKMARNDVSEDAYARLEERVRVLERIATDKNHALAEQIEELRGLNAIEDLTAGKEPAR